MRYVVPLLLDEQKEVTGFFSATTTEGAVVVIFANKAKWKRFSDAVSRLLRSSGQYLGSIDVEADSFEGAIEELTATNADVLNEATFIPDSAPLVEDIITYFTEAAG